MTYCIMGYIVLWLVEFLVYAIIHVGKSKCVCGWRLQTHLTLMMLYNVYNDFTNTYYVFYGFLFSDIKLIWPILTCFIFWISSFFAEAVRTSLNSHILKYVFFLYVFVGHGGWHSKGVIHKNSFKRKLLAKLLVWFKFKMLIMQ